MGLGIWAGDAELLAGGVAVAMFGGSLYVEVPLADDRRFILRVEFPLDDRGELQVRPVLGEGGCALQLFNFVDVVDKGTAWPVIVGADGEHLLFAHFRVTRRSRDVDPVVTFSVFRGSESCIPASARSFYGLADSVPGAEP